MEPDLPEDEAFQERVRSLMGLIRPMKAIPGTKKRYGRDWDGGYDAGQAGGGTHQLLARHLGRRVMGSRHG